MTYLNDGLHHVLLLRHLNRGLLSLLGGGLINSVSLDVKIEEVREFFLGRVKILRFVLELLEGQVLGRGDSVSAVNHHLSEDLVHQSLLSLRWVSHHKILDVFLKL